MSCMRKIDLSPEARRIVMIYAAKENLAFDVALECLIAEGIKAIYDKESTALKPVNKVV